MSRQYDGTHALLGVGFSFVLVVFYFQLFAVKPFNSDTANALLVAKGMAAGNWQMHGWYLPPDNFWGLDQALAALFFIITSNGILTLRLASVFEWTGLMVLSTYLGTRPRPSTQAMSILAVLLLVPVFGPITADSYFWLPCHVLTVFSMLLTVVLGDQILKDTSNSWGWVFLFMVVTIDCAASDPFFQFILTLPFLIALAFNEARLRKRLSLGFLFLACVAVGMFLVQMNTAWGGFVRVAPDVPPFVTAKYIPSATLNVILAWLGVLGCYPQYLSIFSALLAVLRIPLLFFITLPALNCLRRIKTLDFIDTTLLFIIGANICAVIVAAQIRDQGGERFLLPAWVAGSILAARFMRKDKIITIYCFSTAALTLLAAIVSLAHSPDGQVPVSEREMAYIKALSRHHLTRGYSYYWRASDTTVATDGRIRIVAVRPSTCGTLVPYDWLSTKRWYSGDPKSHSFFVSLPEDGKLSPLKIATNTFGKPSNMFRIRYTPAVSPSMAQKSLDVVTYVYNHPLPPLPRGTIKGSTQRCASVNDEEKVRTALLPKKQTIFGWSLAEYLP